VKFRVNWALDARFSVRRTAAKELKTIAGAGWLRESTRPKSSLGTSLQIVTGESRIGDEVADSLLWPGRRLGPQATTWKAVVPIAGSSQPRATSSAAFRVRLLDSVRDLAKSFTNFPEF
jgi:hypothetical protein